MRLNEFRQLLVTEGYNESAADFVFAAAERLEMLDADEDRPRFQGSAGKTQNQHGALGEGTIDEETDALSGYVLNARRSLFGWFHAEQMPEHL